MDEDLKELIVKADNGDVEAMVMVAGCYNSGLGTDKDEEKAHIYYRRAADRGNVVAAYLAGLGCYAGMGTKQDMNLAVKYIQMAADKGLADAQEMMGILYQNGLAGKFFKEQNAIKYYTMAAKQGHASAQYELGKIYLTEWTKGNKSRFDDGLFWLLCAALHDSEKSKEAMEKAENMIDNGILGRGYPVKAIQNLIERIRQQYPGYIVDPAQ